MLKVETLKEAYEDMKNGVYDFTKDGKCSGCGNCCSNLLPMTKKEIKRIKRYIREHKIKEQKVLAVYANPLVDLTCPFMRKDVAKDRCMIYPVKPEICTFFKCDNEKNGKHYDGNREGMMLVNVREVFFGEEKVYDSL